MGGDELTETCAGDENCRSVHRPTGVEVGDGREKPDAGAGRYGSADGSGME